MQEVWIPVLISIGFDDFTYPFTPQFGLIEKIYQTLETVFHGLSIQPQILLIILCCASYFQLSSQFLDIPMKQSLMFDIEHAIYKMMLEIKLTQYMSMT